MSQPHAPDSLRLCKNAMEGRTANGPKLLGNDLSWLE